MSLGLLNIDYLVCKRDSRMVLVISQDICVLHMVDLCLLTQNIVGLDSVTVSAVVLWSGGNFWPQVRILLLPNFLGKSLGNGWLNTTGPGLSHGDLINVGAVYQVSEMSRHLGTLKIPRRATIEKSRVWYPLPSDIEPSLEHWRDTRKRCCQLTFRIRIRNNAIN